MHRWPSVKSAQGGSLSSDRRAGTHSPVLDILLLCHLFDEAEGVEGRRSKKESEYLSDAKEEKTDAKSYSALLQYIPNYLPPLRK